MSESPLAVPPGPSLLIDHAARCCALVKLDILSRARAYPGLESAVSAVSRLVHWGPTAWPASWCDLEDGDEYGGDCGVHADIVAHVARSFGIAVARGFAILESGETRTSHWRDRWEGAHLRAGWLDEGRAFHELVHLESLGWWDPSEARPVSGTGEALEAGRVISVSDDWSRADRP